MAAVASAQVRVPPPQFESGYKLPETISPPVKPVIYEYVDVGVLVVALGLSALLALKWRSRRGLLVLMLFSLGYFGFYRRGCICPIGAVQNVVSGVCLPGVLVPVFVILFFLLPLVATLLFGRTFCAAVCPLGAIQDVVVARPLRVPTWLGHALGLLAYVYLGLAVLYAAIGTPATGSPYLICRYDPFIALFRISGNFNMVILGISFLVLGLFLARPYCRFLCPYGVLLRWLSRVSFKHVTITPDECVQCRLCEESCPFDAIHYASPARPGPPRTQGKRLLAGMLILLPVLTAGAGALGAKLGGPLSRLHNTVRKAEDVYLEDTGRLPEPTEPAEAFRESKQPTGQLHAKALALRGQFNTGGAVFGAFIGFVIGAKLVRLSVRRRREDYEPDKANCIACGRCFLYCPIERRRREESKSTNDTKEQEHE